MNRALKSLPSALKSKKFQMSGSSESLEVKLWLPDAKAISLSLPILPLKPNQIHFFCEFDRRWEVEGGGILISPCNSLGNISGNQHYKKDRLGDVTMPW